MFSMECVRNVTLLKRHFHYDYAFFSFQVREKLSDLRCLCCPDNTASGVWFASGRGLRFVQILNLISYLGSRVQIFFLILNTVRSRFSESRMFEFPLRPSLCAAVKVVSDEFRIQLKCVSLRSHVSLFSGITVLPSNRFLCSLCNAILTHVPLNTMCISH
jgi:hypothetical protein